MGMAASQARFLGLTARQNNVEFEGQQINQQRTMLSNESANYYNDLLGMTVPVPPSVDSYTKTVYTFSDGALTNTVTAMIAQSDGRYTMSYLSKWQDDYTPVSAATSVITEEIDPIIGIPTGNYVIGSDELRTLASLDPNETNPDVQAAKQREEQGWETLLNQKYGTANWYVRYVMDTTLGTERPFFYKQDDVQNALYDNMTHVSLSNINAYTIGSEEKVTEIKAVEDCLLEKDSSGRLIKLSIPKPAPTATDPNAVVYMDYALTTETTTDQDAYNDAMNGYEYEKYLYDQAIEKINSKIEIIQAEDKNLELRLKQLDTERNAIQTEKESVSKVIEKNVQESFKSFQA